MSETREPYTVQDEQDENRLSPTEIEEPSLKEAFSRFPIRVLRAVNLSQGARLLFADLVAYAWEDGQCIPGRDTLCANMNASAPTLGKWMKELREAKLIKTVRRGLGKTNVYVFLPFSSAILEPPPCRSKDGFTSRSKASKVVPDVKTSLHQEGNTSLHQSFIRLRKLDTDTRARGEVGDLGENPASPSSMMASVEREDLNSAPPTPLPPAPQAKGRSKKAGLSPKANPMDGIEITPVLQEVFELGGIQELPREQARIAHVAQKHPDVDLVMMTHRVFDWTAKKGKPVHSLAQYMENWCPGAQAEIDAMKAAGTYKPALRSVGGTGASQPRPLLENVGLTDDEMTVLMAASQKKAEQARSDKSHEDEMPDAELDEILRGIV